MPESPRPTTTSTELFDVFKRRLDAGPGLAILDFSWSKVDSIYFLQQQSEGVAGGIIAMKIKVVAVFSICILFTTARGAVPDFAARADDLEAAIYNGVNQLRQTCGVVDEDPKLTVAAQRHANDLLVNGVGSGHIGSDGSSPQARIADAGYIKPGYTSEIVYWGTGSHATPSAALDLWMESPAHRAIILDCAFTAAGFAIASDGNKMIAVGDFAAP